MYYLSPIAACRKCAHNPRIERPERGEPEQWICDAYADKIPGRIRAGYDNCGFYKKKEENK